MDVASRISIDGRKKEIHLRVHMCVYIILYTFGRSDSYGNQLQRINLQAQQIAPYGQALQAGALGDSVSPTLKPYPPPFGDGFP